MSEHIHVFQAIEQTCENHVVIHRFQCLDCAEVHECAEDRCQNLVYNRDQTHVCTLTGLCHGPRIFERFPTNNGQNFNSVSDVLYIPRVKKCQQIKNKVLTYDFILEILNSHTIIEKPSLTETHKQQLMKQIIDLWAVFIHFKEVKKQDLRRKDRRAFVVSILFSLKDGFCTHKKKYVVSPHPQIELCLLNKKRRYNKFSISDIRYGKNLIRSAFEDTNDNKMPITEININDIL